MPWLFFVVVGGTLWWLSRPTVAAKTQVSGGGAAGASGAKVLDRAAAQDTFRPLQRGARPATIGTPFQAVRAEVYQGVEDAKQDAAEAVASGESMLMMVVGATETTQAAYDAGTAAIGATVDALATSAGAAQQAAEGIDRTIAAGLRGYT